jgi:hypothetical protein
MISDPTVDRDAWEMDDHEHCRCGARLLPVPPPWPGKLCAGCGHIHDDCPCRDGCCESCGWGPT